MFKVEFDTSRFRTLPKKAKIAFTKGVISGVDFGMTELTKAMHKNLMGAAHPVGTPSPYPGTLPVTRISRQASGAIAQIRISPTSGVVFGDLRRASYLPEIEFGTRLMLPRPFARAAVIERGPAVFNRYGYEIKIEMRKAGF